MNDNNGIAIVGIDCRYPGANNINEYWENILALRQQFRRMPDQRLNLQYYGTDDKNKADYSYCKKAAVLNGYEFDRLKYKVSKSTFEQTDLAHWLALDVAAGALKDAGFENGEGLNRKRVGVVLGNSLNGEFTRANIMRLRWPYVFKVLESTLSGLKYNKEDIAQILAATEKIYKEPFPIPTADTLAGGLSNTIAGRICNYFDFNGGGYTIDGACSSSLLAFADGCNAIVNKDLDVVLVGGVDLSIDPFELVGFSRNGALAEKEMEVYSTKSQGFWPGEGCGVAVLMDAKVAKEKGLRIYSVIKGWGISSDGKGGITRPKPETQQLAFERAYKKANYGIETVAMFEGHGTGTPLGDKVELTAIVNAIKSSGIPDKVAAVGSVKHLIGHTKAAAGIAGVIKVCMALNDRIIPASRSNTPHNVLRENEDFLKLTSQPLPWKENTPMRASVSSMGFGGINVHLTMEEAKMVPRKNKLPGKVKKLSHSFSDVEVFPVSGSSKESFVKELKDLKVLAIDISRSEFIDLSISILEKFRSNGIWKASFVARTPDQLASQIEELLQNIDTAKTYTNVENGIFFNATGKESKIAFLFPGQGAPTYKSRRIFESLNLEKMDLVPDEIMEKKGVVDTDIVQPIIIEDTLSSLQLLNQLGVSAEYGIGHSLGEIAALTWAGTMTPEDAVNLAVVRGNAMMQHGEEEGAMLALKCDEASLKRLMKGVKVSITGFNGHGSFVIGGHQSEIAKIQELAVENEIQNATLKVSHAFHTPMMKQAAIHFKEGINANEFNKPYRSVISTVTGDRLREDVNLKDHLFDQIENPVLFTQAIGKIENDVEFLFELGSGKSLSRTLASTNLNVISLDFGSKSLEGFLKILSAAYVAGNDITFDELPLHRFKRTFNKEKWELKPLVNPCEKLELDSSLIRELIEEKETQNGNLNGAVPGVKLSPTSNDLEGVVAFMKNLISEKTEIPVEMISETDRILSELHLNSLAITEIISVVTKNFNKDHKVFSAASIMANADSTIFEVSKFIYEKKGATTDQAKKKKLSFENLPNWTHVFRRVEKPSKVSEIKASFGPGTIKVIDKSGIAKNWEAKLKSEGLKVGNGHVFVYDQNDTDSLLMEFIEFLNNPEVRQSNFICLVSRSHIEANNSLLPIFRTFQLEVPSIRCFSVAIDIANTDPYQLVAQELNTAFNYQETIYKSDQQRYISIAEPCFHHKNEISQQIESGDLVLATGGGKGITFESIYELAKTTGARLAIVGRSMPEQNETLKSNLAKLSEAGIEHYYYSIDVCEGENVRSIVNKIQSKHGTVKVLVHGAGINNPKSLQTLTPADFEKTMKTKVFGLKNIVKVLDMDQLKVLVGFGSIISQSGMRGNGDYAWANEKLGLMVEEIGQKYPNCRCINMEWSVWDETGMGVNLNSIDSLKEIGVWPISVKNGIDIFKKLIASEEAKGRYIITGRYGNIPTLNFGRKRPPAGRFISKIKYHIPQVECISEVSISLKDDIYLNNHVFQKQYVFPTVMILEAMAQVCGILNDTTGTIKFKNLKINKSIFVPKTGANQIRVSVTKIDNSTFFAAVQSEDSNFEVNCFEAELAIQQAVDFGMKLNGLSKLKHLDFDVESKFYDQLLFHHGPFRRIKSFMKIKALESVAFANSSMEDKWFSPYVNNSLTLGDPGINDAAIHCHQACRPGFSLLPLAAGEITFNPNPIEGPFFIKTFEKKEEGNNTIIDVIVVNEKGEIKEQWKDLVLAKVNGTSFSGKWDPHLLVPHIEYNTKIHTKAKTVNLSLDNCMEVFSMLAQHDASAPIDLGDCKIILKKQKNGFENEDEQVIMELELENIDEKTLVLISK